MRPTKMLLPLLFGSLLTQQTTAAPNASSATQFKKSSSLHFIENKGQVVDQHHNPRTDIDFKIPAGNGLNIFIGTGKIHYQWTKHETTPSSSRPEWRDLTTTHDDERIIMYRMDVTLLNANPHAEVITEEKQPYYEQYYLTHTGPDGATAHVYRKITYKEVYPHIDWVFRINNEGKLEHDFIVRPGGKVSDIRLQYAGADSLRCSSDGSIIAVTPFGMVTESTPYCFQQNGIPVAGKFILENNTLGFVTAAHQGTLIIDPVLEWATYFGGVSDDQINGVSADAGGSIYVTGLTSSAANIATTGSFQDTITASTDAFVARFRADGHCIWSTYYGSEDTDQGYGVSCDRFGNVYASGITRSKTGIATTGSHQHIFSGGTTDAFIVKFDTSGHRVWATYVGGTRNESEPGNIVCDKWGNVYLSGATTSFDSISTSGAHQEAKQGTNTGNDAFLIKFDSAGHRLWGTYFGGSTHDYGYDVSCDTFGYVLLAGRTNSTTIAGITANDHQSALAGQYDYFIAMFDSSGTFKWGTYYGGAGQEYQQVAGIFDQQGHLYLAGTTASVGGISASVAFQDTFAGGGADAFLAKFDTTGKWIWATYYGGERDDYGDGLATDGDGHVYLAGRTNSTTGITDAGSLQPGNSGLHDAFLVKFNDMGQRIWATYYGGAEDEYGICVANGGYGRVCMVGMTKSITDFATRGSHQEILGGGDDGFIVLINDCALSAPDTITGPLFVCSGEIVSYKVVPVSGALSYVWTLPSGWSGSSSVDSILVTTGKGNDTIRVVAQLICGVTSEQKIVVSVSPDAFITTMGTSLCAGDSIFLYANTHPDMSWQWLHNNTAIVGTDSILLASQQGIYSLLTTVGHCTDTSDPIVIHPLPLPRITQDGNILSTESHFLSYQWYYGTQSIAGATQSSYVYTAAGAYRVSVRDTNGCSELSELFTPVHVSFIGTVNGIRIYPNPANAMIHVSGAGLISATINAMDGRKILSTEQTDNIDISTLADGLYLLQVKDEAGRIIHKDKITKSSF